MNARGCATIFLLCFLGGASILLAQTPDVQAKFRLAQGFEQAGEYERAAELYLELHQRDPANFPFFEGLQKMYVQLKRYDEAVAVIRERLKMLPNDAPLYGMLGTVLYRAGREREAMNAWESVIALGPVNPQSYRIVASLMIENRLLDKAAETYRRGRQGCGDPQLFTLELAQLLIASLDYAGATEEFLRWLTANPAQLSFVQTRLASFTYKEEGRAEAIRIVRAHLDDQPTLRLYELLAWLHMEGKDFDRAFDVYRHIDDLSSAGGASLLGFADRAYRERFHAVALRAYREALEKHLPPQQLPHARYGLACAQLELELSSDSTGRPAYAGMRSLDSTRTALVDARDAFSRVVADYPQTEYSARALYQIGLIQLRYFRDLNGAASTFQRVLAEPAARPSLRMDVQLRLAELMIAKAETTNAIAALRTILGTPSATPDQSDEAQLRLAEIAFFNGRIDDAVTALAAISVNVNNDFANDAIALQVLLQENAGGPPQALVQYGRAEYMARQHKIGEAVGMLTDLVRQYPASPLVDDALLRAGELLTQTGRYQEAVETYGRLLTEFREQSRRLDRALLRSGEVQQFGLARPAEAIATYERLLAEYPKSVLADTARKRIRALRGETL